MLNNLKTVLFMGALFGLFLFLGEMWAGPRGMTLAFVLALVINLSVYWFSDRLVLAMYRAQEVDEYSAPHLVRMVRTLAMRAGLPMPRVYIVPSGNPNAFATGRDPAHAAVAVTDGLLHSMDEDELQGVLAHEIAHIKNRDTLISTLAATFAAAITMLARMAYWASLFGGFGRDDDEGGNPLAALLMLILAPIAAVLIQMAISRSREYKADEDGARLAGNPLGLAEALRKLEWFTRQHPMVEANPSTAHLFIVHPFRGGLLDLFRTHPRTEDRIARLEAMARQRGF